MKNLKGLLLGVALIGLVTGCGNKEQTLVCTDSQSASGVKVNQEVSMTFKNDKVKIINMTVDSKATSDTIKDNWDTFASTMSSQYKDKKTDGITLKTTNDKKNYSYKVSIDIDLDKASKESLSEYNLSSITKSKEGLEDVKKSAENDGYTCKVK